MSSDVSYALAETCVAMGRVSYDSDIISILKVGQVGGVRYFKSISWRNGKSENEVKDDDKD